MKKGVRMLRDYTSHTSRKKYISKVKKKSSTKKPAAPNITPPQHLSHPSPHHHLFIKFITFLAALILTFFVIYIFYSSFTPPKSVDISESQPTTYLDIIGLTCAYEQNDYRICGNFAWIGAEGSYARVTFADSEDTATPQKYSSRQFTHCQNVDAEETTQYHNVQLSLHTPGGTLIKDINKFVTCAGKPKPIVKKPFTAPKSQTILQKSQLYAYKTAGKSDGFGSYDIKFPGKAQSCVIEDGTFHIKDKQLQESFVGICHNAQGTFTSYADQYQQYTTTDPSFFTWDGISKQDPLPVFYDGYFSHIKLCDEGYSQKERNYVRAKMTGFGTDVITVDWEYKDITGKRRIDVLFALECDVNV